MADVARAGEAGGTVMTRILKETAIIAAMFIVITIAAMMVASVLKGPLA